MLFHYYPKYRYRYRYRNYILGISRLRLQIEDDLDIHDYDTFGDTHQVYTALHYEARTDMSIFS